MASLSYCAKCKAIVPLSLGGKCKRCGTLTEVPVQEWISERNWDSFSNDAKEQLLNKYIALKNEDSLNEHMITTTQSFEGKRIEAYYGTVSGTDIYLVGGAIGGGLANQEELFGKAFFSAKKKMFQKALKLGANAVVGMQSIMTSPGGLNNMIVVVTGTAVKVQEEPKVSGATEIEDA